MKTKFSGVVQVAKKNIDRLELILASSRAKANKLATDIEILTTNLKSYKFPKNGDFILIKIGLEEQRLLRKQKDDIQEQLNLVRTQISHYENQYKKAYIEFEKMKYLENEEIKKNIQKVKRLESIALDEIAVQRHSFIKDLI